VTLAQAGSLQLDAVSAVDDAIQDRITDGWVTEHHMMPRTLSGESLRSGWLIPVTRCLAAACRSVIACPVVVLV
jgi:hypothetical protein